MTKRRVKVRRVQAKPYYGSHATSGAFTNPFPYTRAESRIAGGGERVTEDDPRAKRRRKRH